MPLTESQQKLLRLFQEAAKAGKDNVDLGSYPVTATFGADLAVVLLSVTFPYAYGPGLSTKPALQEMAMPKENTDAALAAFSPHFPQLKGLNSLDFAAAQLTDAGMAHVAKLATLQKIDLGWTNLTDVGLAHLRYHHSLKDISLIGTCITDTGLAHLANLNALESIALIEVNVSDAGLIHISNWKGLKSIWLDPNAGNTHHGITDVGLINVADLHDLEFLCLRY